MESNILHNVISKDILTSFLIIIDKKISGLSAFIDGFIGKKIIKILEVEL